MRLLEAILDDSVGQTVKLTLERNGQLIDHELTVADLHAITPSEYIQFSDGVFHDVSYQQAWHFNKPINGVYIAMCNRVGKEDDMEFYGESIIVDPDGNIIAKADEAEQILSADIDLFLVDEARKNRPYLALLRPETYE